MQWVGPQASQALARASSWGSSSEVRGQWSSPSARVRGSEYVGILKNPIGLEVYFLNVGVGSNYFEGQSMYWYRIGKIFHAWMVREW